MDDPWNDLLAMVERRATDCRRRMRMDPEHLDAERTALIECEAIIGHIRWLMRLQGIEAYEPLEPTTRERRGLPPLDCPLSTERAA